MNKRLFVVGALLALSACSVAGEPKADVYSVPAGERIYDGYAVTVDGQAAPVSEVRVSAVPFNRRWPGHQRQIDQTELAGMVRFAFTNRARVAIRPTKPFKTVKVRPLSRKVKPLIRDGVVTFDLVKPGGYSVEFDSYHNNLHVFADAPADYGVSTMTPKVRHFGPGEHDVGIVNLKDGETVYLDPGAVVYGMFHASNRTDVAILGRGILDASRIKEKILFPAKGDGKEDCRNAQRWHTIHFIGCRGCRIDGITIRDSLCYNIGFWGCEDIDIRNVKIIGQWRFNTDGIDLHNCRRGRVRDCFARCFDDVYCFKAHLDPGTDCEDLVFENCVAWADWGKCFEVGVECRADHLRRLRFLNCDCIRGCGTILDVENVDWGEVSDVTFQDIRIEMDDPLPPLRMQKSDEDRFQEPENRTEGPLLFSGLIRFHHEYSVEKGGRFTGAGKINGVTLRNVDVLTKFPPRSQTKGFDADHTVKGVVFDNVTVNGRRVREPKDFGFMQGPFAETPQVRYRAEACAASTGAIGVKLKGYLGERLDAMIERHVAATDVDYIVAPFKEKTERRNWWQTEFWGKYMHSAPLYQAYCGSERLRASIERGVDTLLASQEPCGYIGNYPEDLRCGEGWDVWGMKYTMMGLLHYADWKGGERGEAAQAACCRLCDYLIGEIGPNGKRGRAVWQTGNWSGYASSSVLEPVMWLYRRTGEKRYLDFAAFIVKGMEEPAEGPRLVDLALKGVSVADRDGDISSLPKETGYVIKHRRFKAYEMMSCYQGLLEFYEVSGRKDLLEAAVKTAEDIVCEEINLAGGCACAEVWFHGAHKQHLPYFRLQETCVLTTWMRLCAKLLDLTDDPKWADQLERTFYNAYLASMKADGSAFAAYTPLTGYRGLGHDHCFMHTDCCTANGPRGFLCFLRAFFRRIGETATFNFYSSALVDGFEMYSRYPRQDEARIVSHVAGRMKLRLRIPS